ncbi:MAG TPA: DUF1444 family protein [Roseiflexaceae bacterium]|nr:DUF1444 family protein [Roseiflexaceae bacterium]HMP42205.1 DUF1444 family protein [Roseiflexaceae bacterium]
MSDQHNGAPPPMTEEQFAGYIERRLGIHDEMLAHISREGNQLRLRINERDVSVDLTRFYQAYTRQPAQLDAVVQTLIHVLLDEIPQRDEQDFAALAPRIRPMLKPIDLLATVRERGVPMIAYRELLADLIITYVIDEQRSVAYINEDQLERWGIGIDQLHERALANLRRATADVRFTTVGEGEQRLYIFNSGDGYDATRLLLTDILAEWARSLPGRLVIGIPNRDFLIALSDADSDILRSVAHQIQADAEQRQHGLTNQLFTLAGGVIRTFDWE